MRLNAQTLVLLGAAILIIVVFVVLDSQSTTTTEATATPSGVAGALLEGVDVASINQFELRNHATSEYLRLSKTGGTWNINATYQTDVVAPDDALVDGNISTYAALQYSDSFESDNLAAFGLDQPVYTLSITTADGIQHLLHIGQKNMAGNRYYAIAEEAVADALADLSVDATVEATAETTAEASAEATADPLASVWDGIVIEPRPTLSGMNTILLVNSSTIDQLLGLIAMPPYQPLPTFTPMPTNTPNPFSEVDQTATASAAFATFEAQMTAQATAEATAEASAEITVEITREATPEATPE